jgi:CBS domain-containing protein
MMSRDDLHMDAMLRHLGASYYDSLHGRAAKADVTRAVDQVAERIGEQPEPRLPAARGHRDRVQRDVPRHHGRLHSRVRDVMTAQVVSVDRTTPFKEIAELLVAHQVSGVPVLGFGRKVVGVVTEDDLIAARDTRAGEHRTWTGLRRFDSDHARYLRLTGEQLMTSPPMTIHPDASIAAAAKLMGNEHVKRLPVVDADGKLIGLVSRRDLLRVFCIPDSEIARQFRELLAEAVSGEPAAGEPEPGELGSITVAAHGGIVTLAGEADTPAIRDAIAAAIPLAWDLDGVVDILNHVTTMQPV